METETFQDICYRKRLAVLAEAGPFQKCFKVRLKLFYPNMVLGLDVVAFDKWLQPEVNESTWDAIQRKYGAEGTRIIKILIA